MITATESNSAGAPIDPGLILAPKRTVTQLDRRGVGPNLLGLAFFGPGIVFAGKPSTAIFERPAFEHRDVTLMQLHSGADELIVSSNFRLTRRPDEAKLESLRKYIRTQVKAGEIQESLAEQAWNALQNISRLGAGVPDAYTLSDGGFAFSWDKDNDHLTLDFYEDQIPFFFYADRRNSTEIWDSDWPISERIPDRALEVLNRIR